MFDAIRYEGFAVYQGGNFLGFHGTQDDAETRAKNAVEDDAAVSPVLVFPATQFTTAHIQALRGENRK